MGPPGLGTTAGGIGASSVAFSLTDPGHVLATGYVILSATGSDQSATFTLTVDGEVKESCPVDVPASSGGRGTVIIPVAFAAPLAAGAHTVSVTIQDATSGVVIKSRALFVAGPLATGG